MSWKIHYVYFYQINTVFAFGLELIYCENCAFKAFKCAMCKGVSCNAKSPCSFNKCTCFGFMQRQLFIMVKHLHQVFGFVFKCAWLSIVSRNAAKRDKGKMNDVVHLALHPCPINSHETNGSA